MLVLTRRLEESILIGNDIEIKVLHVRGTGPQAVVRLGIVAPRSVAIVRKEIYDEVVAANRQAAHAAAALPAELLRALSSSGGQPQPEDQPGGSPGAAQAGSVRNPSEGSGSNAPDRPENNPKGSSSSNPRGSSADTPQGDSGHGPQSGTGSTEQPQPQR